MPWRKSSDDSLYAGGSFIAADGVVANGVARWDGATSSWHALGSGIGGTKAGIYALACGAGRLALRRRLLHHGWWSGSQQYCPLGRYDVASPWGSGMEGCAFDACVLALALGPDGSLYAGGYFTTAGGVATNKIARWDGTTWHPLGSGMNEFVNSLAPGPDGSLYAGGQFTYAGEVVAQKIARWDGTTGTPWVVE